MNEMNGMIVAFAASDHMGNNVLDILRVMYIKIAGIMINV